MVHNAVPCVLVPERLVLDSGPLLVVTLLGTVVDGDESQLSEKSGTAAV